MNSWAPLWSGLVDSSIWEEPDHVFRVFMAMMSLKDAGHIVSLSGYTLAKRIHMDLEKVLDAERILSAPDTRRPGQEFDGRRIEPVDGGWLILKGEFYRKLVREEMKRTRNRKSQQAYRDRRKQAGTGAPLAGEAAYVKSLENGDATGATKILESLSKPGVDWDNVCIPATSKEVNKTDMDAASGREIVPEPPEMEIPEIPVLGQGAPGDLYTEPSGHSTSAGPEPATESGRIVDGDWVPD